nr:MAG TPA: hypothetical protein [Caudoviricetes sp.]
MTPSVFIAFLSCFRDTSDFYRCFGKEEVTSSNLVNSSRNLHAISGSFRGCVLFGFRVGNTLRALSGH